MSESADFYMSWLGCSAFGVASSQLLVAPTPVPFAPTDLSDCLLWYDANNGATISTDVDNSILAWASLGSATDFTLGPNTGSAFSGIDTINGLNVATFSAGKNMITGAASLNTQESTWFYVVESLTDLATEAVPFLLLYNGNDTAAYSLGVFYDGGSMTYGVAIGAAGVSSTLGYDLSGNPYPSPLVYSFRLTSDATGNFIKINGQSITLTESYPAVGFNTSAITWTVGRADGTSMNVGEIICYGRSLSDSEVVQVSTYLSDRWAIPLA